MNISLNSVNISSMKLATRGRCAVHLTMRVESTMQRREITYVRVRPACVPRGDRSSSLVSAAGDIVGMRNSRLSSGLPSCTSVRAARSPEKSLRRCTVRPNDDTSASLFTNTHLIRARAAARDARASADVVSRPTARWRCGRQSRLSVRARVSIAFYRQEIITLEHTLYV